MTPWTAVIYTRYQVLFNFCGVKSQLRAVRVACNSSDLFQTRRMPFPPHQRSPPCEVPVQTRRRCFAAQATAEVAGNRRCLPPRRGISDVIALFAGWLQDLCSLCMSMYLRIYKCIPRGRCYDALRQESRAATLRWADIAQLELCLPICFGEKICTGKRTSASKQK